MSNPTASILQFATPKRPGLNMGSTAEEIAETDSQMGLRRPPPFGPDPRARRCCRKSPSQRPKKERPYKPSLEIHTVRNESDIPVLKWDYQAAAFFAGVWDERNVRAVIGYDKK
jgi:hypothetical protein